MKPITTPMIANALTLRHAALDALVCDDIARKITATQTITDTVLIDADLVLIEPSFLPGRSLQPLLISPREVPQRAISTLEGRAALIHSLAHIELNAVNLGLDIIWRFPSMPKSFYLDWLKVAKEEAKHFIMLRDHLKTLGYDYGDFPAHNGLWDMAEKTKGDILARLGLVPRTLEARGLDVSPLIRSKLASVGDYAGATVLDVILKEEIGHVAIGNYWYNWVCQQRGVDAITSYRELTERYDAPVLRGPFNIEARRAAGFAEAELIVLGKH